MEHPQKDSYIYRLLEREKKIKVFSDAKYFFPNRNYFSDTKIFFRIEFFRVGPNGAPYTRRDLAGLFPVDRRGLETVKPVIFFFYCLLKILCLTMLLVWCRRVGLK